MSRVHPAISWCVASSRVARKWHQSPEYGSLQTQTPLMQVPRPEHSASLYIPPLWHPIVPRTAAFESSQPPAISSTTLSRAPTWGTVACHELVSVSTQIHTDTCRRRNQHAQKHCQWQCTTGGFARRFGRWRDLRFDLTRLGRGATPAAAHSYFDALLFLREKKRSSGKS